MPTRTSLAVILNDMDFYQDIEKVEPVYKVRALDNAIRRFRRKTAAPWMLKRTQLRVFDGVLEYPVQSDHDEMAFFDDTTKTYDRKPQFRYTSVKEFYIDPNNRNDVAEIWDGGDRYLGVRYKNGSLSGNSLLNGGESTTGWVVGGDAGTPVLDTVFFREGSSSIRIPITYSTGIATIQVPIDSFSDSDYKRKYPFVYLNVPSVPTSVNIQFGNSVTNQVSASVTTQFSGVPIKAGEWGVVAIDLNTATVTGTIDTSAFDYFLITLNGVTTGNVYIDSVYLKQWSLLDYWYYSKYYCQTVAATAPDQEFFMNSSEIYLTDTSLIGDSEWVDMMRYDALEELTGNIKDKFVKDHIAERRADAIADFYDTYPNLVPSITTSRYNYESDNDQDNSFPESYL